MKFHPKYFLFLLVIPAIMACNLSSLAAGTAVPSGPSNKTSPFPTAGKVGVPLPELEGQARQVVIEFLSSLQSDPTGKKAETYLGPTLMKKVSGGEPVINLLAQKIRSQNLNYPQFLSARMLPKPAWTPPCFTRLP